MCRHSVLIAAALVACVAASTPRAASRGAAPFGQTSARDFLAKSSPDVLRVMTWNIGRDSVFPSDGRRIDLEGTGRPAQYARVLRALQPDVMCLQEVNIRPRRVAAVADDILPLPDGRKWQAHRAVDNVLVSRFAFSARGDGSVEGIRRRGHAIALIDVSTAGRAVPVHVTCAHFQSSNGPEEIDMRRRHADLILRAIRDAKAGRGGIPIPPRTPFVILGDLNAVPGLTAFLDTMLTGGEPEAATGTGNGLDWDGSAITDALPHHNSSGPGVYTWRDDMDRFPPSALDRVLYSDSVLDVANRFVLDTTTMSYEELRRSRMRSIDVMRDPQAGIHDHFPVVVDFLIRNAATD